MGAVAEGVCRNGQIFPEQHRRRLAWCSRTSSVDTRADSQLWQRESWRKSGLDPVAVCPVTKPQPAGVLLVGPVGGG